MEPYLLNIKNIGSKEEGFLSVISNSSLPFIIRRVFWTVNTPLNVIRGRHAHHNTNMILIAAIGTIHVSTISEENNQQEFILNEASKGLFIPKLCWHEMEYNKDAVQLVLTDTEYEEADYIRDKNKFFEIISKQE